MIESRLTLLQRDLLEAFFARSADFHLTGGAALAGFHLGHWKDSGLTPAQLGFVLSGIRIGDDARIPGRRSASEVRE